MLPIARRTKALLEHSIQHLNTGDESDLQFALLHADNSVEILLKYYLRFSKKLTPAKVDNMNFFELITKSRAHADKFVNNEYVNNRTEEGLRELSEDYIRAELKTIFDHGVEVSYDNRLQSFDRETFDEDYALEYGQYLAFKNSGIKRADSFQYVTDAISQGYEIIKW